MTGLESIINQIAGDAQQEASEILAGAKERAEKAAKEAQEEAKRQADAILQKGEQDAKDIRETPSFLLKDDVSNALSSGITSRKNVVFFWLHKNTSLRTGAPSTFPISAHSSIDAAGSLSTRSKGIPSFLNTLYTSCSRGTLSLTFSGGVVTISLIYIVSSSSGRTQRQYSLKLYHSAFQNQHFSGFPLKFCNPGKRLPSPLQCFCRCRKSAHTWL